MEIILFEATLKVFFLNLLVLMRSIMAEIKSSIYKKSLLAIPLPKLVLKSDSPELADLSYVLLVKLIALILQLFHFSIQ